MPLYATPFARSGRPSAVALSQAQPGRVPLRNISMICAVTRLPIPAPPVSWVSRVAASEVGLSACVGLGDACQVLNLLARVTGGALDVGSSDARPACQVLSL